MLEDFQISFNFNLYILKILFVEINNKKCNITHVTLSLNKTVYYSTTRIAIEFKVDCAIDSPTSFHNNIIDISLFLAHLASRGILVGQ